jgi:hypothetical protein
MRISDELRNRIAEFGMPPGLDDPSVVRWIKRQSSELEAIDFTAENAGNAEGRRRLPRSTFAGIFAVSAVKNSFGFGADRRILGDFARWRGVFFRREAAGCVRGEGLTPRREGAKRKARARE